MTYLRNVPAMMAAAGNSVLMLSEKYFFLSLSHFFKNSMEVIDFDTTIGICNNMVRNNMVNSQAFTLINLFESSEGPSLAHHFLVVRVAEVDLLLG